MKIVLFLGFISFASHVFAQEYGTISGRITSPDGPVPFATIQVQGYPASGIADHEGKFSIDKVPIGERTLVVRGMGFQTLHWKVDVKKGELIDLNLNLRVDNLNLNEVVVSASRYEMDRKESPVIVNVITPDLFKATQSISMADALNFQPGVRVENNCQNCGFTQVRLNGLEGAYSQILINSRPVFSALTSVYGLEQIPASMIERVEIVRSGGSALYGSNAIAGTINIITKEPILNSWQIGSNYALVDGAASDRTINLNGSLVSDDLNSGVTLYGMSRDRDAFDANGDGFTEVTTLQNITLGTRAFLKPTDFNKVILEVNAIKEHRRGGNRLNLAPHFTDITEQLDHTIFIAGLTYDQYSRNKKNKLSTYASLQNSKRLSYYGGLGGGRTREDSLAAANAYGLTYDLSFAGGMQLTRSFGNSDALVVGIEYQLSDVEDRIPGYSRRVDQQVNMVGLYGQYEWKPNEKLTTLVGGRYDWVYVSGEYEVENVYRTSEIDQGVFSPRLTLLYKLNNDLQFRSGYARGFRTPQAFNEDLHISSVGGEPQFVILSNDLKTEFSNAYTVSFDYDRNIGSIQTDLLVEGFYTDLTNPFTTVSTGATLLNGSILEEVRNGAGAYVTGVNIELNVAPSSKFLFQGGGTVQRSIYKEPQIVFEPELPNEDEPTVSVDRFLRTPNVYGFVNTNWTPVKPFSVDVTGVYTGSMMVPRVVSESGFINLVNTESFYELNVRLSYVFKVQKSFSVEWNGGVQNVFNSFQKDFDTGPTRDSDYIYGPIRPRTFFMGLKIGSMP